MALKMSSTLSVLRAAGESTRLRLLALLSEGELNVSEITQILSQSQPRISRHLKLLTESGLVERYREGSWVFLRLADSGPEADLLKSIMAGLDRADPVLARDRSRADAVAKARAEVAHAYFRSHASDWDRIRSLHLDELRVEEEILAALGPGPFDLFVDLGTGTGRMLELVAPRIKRGVGIDLSPEMLAYARAKLDRPHLRHCQARQGDLLATQFPDGAADVVLLHQVLHFLDDPVVGAIKEAARVLAPGGRLLIVDFAPHTLEFLRDDFAHRRLGFEAAQVDQFIADAGLYGVGLHKLPPALGHAGEDKLTVLIWSADKPEQLAKPRLALERELA